MICIYDTIDRTIYFIKRNYFCVYRYRMKQILQFITLLFFLFFLLQCIQCRNLCENFFFDNSFRLSSSFVFCLRVKKKKIYTKKYISEKEVFNFLFRVTQYLSDVSIPSIESSFRFAQSK